VSAALRRSFSALQIPNYRRYFAGQIVSLSGNWMQTVAEMWLILELTDSGIAVGATAALQFLPMLLLGVWGGVLADRWPKRRLLIATQATMAVPALGLWALTASGAVEPWMVFALVLARGMVTAVDHPTRQAFVIEMVGSDRIVNAVGLNSVLIHSARIFGPAGAGLLIATVGIAPCFLLNAATFAAMIVALRAMDPRLLAQPAKPERDQGGVGAAVRYLRGEPRLLIPLAMMALVGTLAFNFQVLLPLLGRFAFEGGALAYTALAIAMALGSILGALATGARGRVSERQLVASCAAFGTCALLAAAAPSLALAMAALVPLGAVSVSFAAGVNSTLQLGASAAMRGRVMAIYSVVFIGSTPIGGPIVGGLAELAGPRAGLVLAAVAALAAATGGWHAFSRSRGRPASLGRLAEPALTRVAPAGAQLGAAGRRWGRRVRRRGTVAVEARGADQPQRLEGRRGLDVEANPVAVLDRRHRGLAPAPGERDQDRVAGSDRRHLRPYPAGAADDEGEDPDRPQPQEGDPARALGREAGRRAGAGEHPRGRLADPLGAPEPDPDQRRDDPPAGGDRERQLVGLTVGDQDADRPQGRGDTCHQQHRHPQQVAERHHRPRSRSRNPSGPATTRSASR
jgi:MFS family permease